MSSKINNDDEDYQLFRKSVADVKPINSDRIHLDQHTKPKPIPRQLEEDKQAVKAEMLSDDYDLDALTGAEEISFKRPGIQFNILRKLKRGQFTINDELDLHGLTVAEARNLLAKFLNQAKKQGNTCIRIIHGKGRRSSNKGPVLKPLVANWLSQRDEVLAYCSARPSDGGSGAVYVLLKKQ